MEYLCIGGSKHLATIHLVDADLYPIYKIPVSYGNSEQYYRRTFIDLNGEHRFIYIHGIAEKVGMVDTIISNLKR